MSVSTSLDPADVARFAAVADQWWDPDGKFAPLHRLNPARLAFIRRYCLEHFSVDGGARAPFSGLRLLDIGCGGGLVAEPMTRLGFQVTGIDAAPESVAVARAHAEGLGLEIDYRETTTEALTGEPPFDVVLALEIIEHVIDPRALVADCARLLAPGGLMIIATLNRTLRSLALGKIAAEYVLRWVPAGAHDWRKFLTPGELGGHLSAAGLTPEGPFGLTLDPLQGQWRLSSDTRINYMMTATGLNRGR
ncbi:MAG TPA: bifunctional 2-polyprenyl-6-hydroxyphenol methylase/3-demethylubiquinol 3-O-methyltransferase UbiG [Caulobacteraceae bacterium]